MYLKSPISHHYPILQTTSKLQISFLDLSLGLLKINVSRTNAYRNYPLY